MPDSNQGELTATERRVAVKRQQLMQNTRQRIFDIALQEFADKGFSGVRVEAIAGLAGVNIRMIYHYFESKQNLYIEVLEFVLGQLRSEELKLKLDIHQTGSVEGILQLYDFIESHFSRHRELQCLLQWENLNKAETLKHSARIQAMSFPIRDLLTELILLGERKGTLRPGIDALHLYVTLVSLSVFHKSNAFTISWMFETDLLASNWQRQHKQQVYEMIRAWLKPVTG
ncbi:TetR/AcrR family transcriptional regulator [Klebsiella sp. BIGb0407]|uniref:TetR/AcrR family transcriptional regulator n=1 Tax=Klebsiella sp. BIGb0407 TaxID=2940603 RepID=UPI002166E2CD|nr:TetR/AcrR family transcriptional regulator [Klebsiella sp. BIGb0407]MCS3430753.1 AcrR family transcriptional regulator [Klebsiella sp. BIGb0407]